MKDLFTRFAREESGQDLIEYALLAGFLSLVAATGAQAVGTNLLTFYNNLATGVGAISTGPLAG